jgi:hypothetical protein
MEALYFKITLRKAKNNHFIKVKLKGEGQNNFGVGSVVELFLENRDKN